ncbi:PREDICTED: DNA replication factor Cdt1 [Rhagoletis zephyria]|uniref:DNA replication factor Cdt1 n=1 Tax=Rhagoletis zephyria TaxID=28612 RepID=UPI00081147FB|nr:PREDICTED: DNA replication factor Cdt1 [Rhagoletis zephyria]XP_017472991.1 PREDICTED: DNA replication factor Cdt1 [Rhagoletis zephyria]
MSQPSIASYFNTRKRVATDEAATIKSRRLTDDNTTPAPSATRNQNDDDDIAATKAAAVGVRTRSGRTIKRTGTQPTADVPAKKQSKVEQAPLQQKTLVQFIRKGPLSPRKKPAAINEMQKKNEETPNGNTATKLAYAFAPKDNVTNVLRGLKTPTKQIIKGSGATPLKHDELKGMVRKELNFDEVKTKLSRSAKLQELKASLSRIQELEKTRKAHEDRNRRLREGQSVSPLKNAAPVVQLKEFDKIELEVLTSPAKTFKTPTKIPPPTPDKNELMSPRHTDVSKRVLFSPAKQGSPSKMVVPPAYQRFMSLAELSKAGQLPLPFKYRNLIEIFKGVDSVCAMFHNRKECITFKKLKPAVQRMLRKNVTETHLAQIKNVYPDAFIFTQMKMRNYGSTSKADYFQLVICPNVDGNAVEKVIPYHVDEDAADHILSAAQSSIMNPLVMIERFQRFTNTLMQRVLNEHEKFLRSLDPPINIPKSKVTRWHPDFDLENCPDIECAHLPQPPNVEKYSSARDILSTARNLFNCATPMERVMERYEAKMEATRVAEINANNEAKNIAETSDIAGKGSIGQLATIVEGRASATMTTTPTTLKTSVVPSSATSTSDVTSNLLKGVPKSLLEKIRAKQAAKALDAMTRRPSQDQEATMYSRLPELARHLRNVFITERKGVLMLEIVIKKIQNSFRACLTAQEMEAHLKLMAKEVPAWVSFHEVRKTMYLKIAREMELKKVIAKLEEVANEKSK